MEILATQLADLFSAVHRSDEKQIRRLLAANVPPNQPNTQGITALMVAAKIGNSKIIKMLRGAIQDKHPSAQLFFSQIVSTFSPAVSPHAALTSFMTADLATNQVTPSAMLGAPVRSSDMIFVSAVLPVFPNDWLGLNDATPLSVGNPHKLYHEDGLATVVYDPVTDPLETQSPETQSLETQSLAPPPLDPPPPEEKQPPIGQSVEDQTELLKKAICNNDFHTVEELLSAGVSVQSANWYDTPLLVLAAKNADSDIVKALIQAGASVNRGYDRLPLNVAADRGNFEIVHTLMCAGAYIEGTEESGYTALMSAAAAGHLLIVQTLIACGANVNVNYYGKTPLMLAARNGHTKVYDFLFPYVQWQEPTDTSHQQQAVLAAQHSQLDREMFSLFESD